MATRYEGAVPQTLRRWCDAHPGLVAEIAHEGGFTTASGNAYDVLVAPGYRTTYDGEILHTIIEPTVRDVLVRLRSIVRCEECDECREHWRRAEPV